MEFSNKQIEDLIDIASKKMGVSQDELKSNLKNKNFDNPVLNELLNDPEKLKKIANNPNIKKMMDKFLNK